jgi:hypothetical protein
MDARPPSTTCAGYGHAARVRARRHGPQRCPGAQNKAWRDCARHAAYRLHPPQVEQAVRVLIWAPDRGARHPCPDRSPGSYLAHALPRGPDRQLVIPVTQAFATQPSVPRPQPAQPSGDKMSIMRVRLGRRLLDVSTMRAWPGRLHRWLPQPCLVLLQRAAAAPRAPALGAHCWRHAVAASRGGQLGSCAAGGIKLMRGGRAPDQGPGRLNNAH